MHLVGGRSGIPMFCRDARGVACIVGGRKSNLLLDGTLFVEFGSLLLDAEAVRAGCEYDIAASGFSWHSRDGARTIVNETAFSGGGLVDSGEGIGTTITPILTSDPMPTTAYIEDEEL